MTRQGTEDNVSAEAILQNLAKRPNVRSTLILSRKDGTIIKASGSVADEGNEELQHGRNYSSVDATPLDAAPQADDQPSHEGDVDAKLTEPKQTRTQILASSIHMFVGAATSLAASLRSVNDRQTALPARVELGNIAQDDSAQTGRNSPAEDDVQLLRLRLKKQEVIIFPDPNYLCCVVQDLDKTSR